MGELIQPVLIGCLLGLAVCVILDGVQIDRLRKDVDFLTTLVSRETLGADHV